jgi:4-hydroxy-2-oxoheptanedioate aldolase
LKAIENQLKRALLESRPLLGLWSSLCSPIAAELLSYTNFDWILIDTEHAPNEISTVMAQLQAMAAGNASPVVRPAWNHPILFKRYLDIGVQNILVPFVQNRVEAERAVAACRYPPAGIRGVAANTRANRYGRIKDYFATCEQEICIIAQLETASAIAAIPDIANVDGLDCLFIGPSDLAASVGHTGNPMHPDVMDMIKKAIPEIIRHGKPAGILAPNEQAAIRFLELGASFVAVGSDLALLSRGADQLEERIRTNSNPA